jgi:hypothetical protein
MGRHSLCSVCYLCTQHVRHACRRRTVLAPWEARNAVLKFNADVQGSANCMMGSCSWKHIWQWAVFLVWVGHRVCYTTTRDFLTDIRQFHWSITFKPQAPGRRGLVALHNHQWHIHCLLYTILLACRGASLCGEVAMQGEAGLGSVQLDLDCPCET